MRYARLKYLLVFLAVFFIGTGRIWAVEKVLDAGKFIKPTDQDVAVALYNMMLKAKKEGYTLIRIPKGVYQVYNDHAFEKYMFISNHDPGRHRVAFPIINFKNLTLDGQGAKFIMHGLMIPVAIENSTNITIKGLEFNYNQATHSEMKVVAIDSVNSTIDFLISKEYPYEIRNGQLYFIKYGGFEHNLENAIYWDPATHAVAYQSNKMTPFGKAQKKAIGVDDSPKDSIYDIDQYAPGYRYRGLDVNYMVKQIKPGLIRIYGVKPKMPKVGWVLVAKGLNGYNRLAPGIRLMGDKNVLVQNVTVHHANGMALIAENCTNIVLDGFKVNADKKDGRMLSVTADGSHFVGCRGKIEIKNCRLENQLDDATNIHGTYLSIVDIGKANNTVGAEIGHFQQSGFLFAKPGDSIAVVNPAINAIPLAILTVKKVTVINPRYYKIEFNETVDPLRTGYYLDNISAYPEVEIHDNEFVNNRARGLLISTPRRTVIERNTFSNMMSSIQCPNEFTFWHESGYVGELIIRNNIFLDSTYGSEQPLPVINIMAESKNNQFIHRKIIVTNNKFINFSSYLLLAEHLQTLIFTNNTLSYSGKYPLLNKTPMLKFEHTGNVEVSGNSYDHRFKLMDANPSVSSITATNNSPINEKAK